MDRGLREMQCFGGFVANNAKWGYRDERLDIQCYNAYPSLTLRSAFALPSLCLRSAFERLLVALVR